MTKAPVNASASSGEENTYWNATRYICVGSAAFSRRDQVLDREKRQERARQHLQHAGHDPARARRQIGGPPAPAPASASRGGRKRRKSTCSPICAISENTTVAAVPNSTRLNVARLASASRETASIRRTSAVASKAMKTNGSRCSTSQTGCVHSCNRLMKRDAVRDQRDDDQRTDDVAGEQRNPEAHFQRERHDRRFDREEQERERGVDQRRDGRADVAEAGAARQQIDVDAVVAA